MTTPTQQQADLDRRQRELNQDRTDATKKLQEQQRELAKAVHEKLAGVPMHDTNIGEVALVVAAVLALRENKHDSHVPAKPAHPAH